MTVDYDPTLGTLKTALILQNTVISEVFHRTEFWGLIIFHCGVRVAMELELFEPEEYHVTLPLSLTGVTGSLMTFFVVFYNGNVFNRYNRFYEVTKQMNEECLNVVMMLSREISNVALRRKLVRMLIASCFLFFFERTQSEDGSFGNVSEDEWEAVVRMGLLDEEQERRLKLHCSQLRKNSVPSLILLHWSMKLYTCDAQKDHELEKAYWEVRKMQDDVVEMLELPMPWQYFHIMNLLVMLNLLLWAYSFALEESYFGSAIFVFVACIFLGIRELCVAMADPYGEDAADFPINEWMNQLYVRVHYLCEDDWTAAEMMHGLSNKQLEPVAEGKTVFDLLSGHHHSHPKESDRNKKESKATHPVESHAHYVPAARKPTAVTPAGDDSGCYVQIPADSEDECYIGDHFRHAD